MLDTLINAIQAKTKTSDAKPFVIAISGFGGSGKSTLASQLQQSLSDADIISIDAFVTNHLSQRSADWEGFDRARFRDEVLIPSTTGKPVCYGVYDWQENAITHHKTLKSAPFLILEGCSILHPSLMGYYSFSIWVDVPLEDATQRGMARDRNQGADAAWLQKWQNVWMPNERDFFEKYRPADHVDFIYKPAES
jgi:uridine kinase